MLTRADEKPMTYREVWQALDACNLTGLLHDGPRFAALIASEATDTDSRNHHPVAIVLADKLAELSGLRTRDDSSNVLDAYTAIRERAGL